MNKHCPGPHPIKLDKSFSDRLNLTIESVLYENNIIISDWKRGRRSFADPRESFYTRYPEPLLIRNYNEGSTMNERQYEKNTPSQNTANSNSLDDISTGSPIDLSEPSSSYTNKILNQSILSSIPKIELSPKNSSEIYDKNYDVEIITAANDQGKRIVILKPKNTKYENVKKIMNIKHDRQSKELIYNSDKTLTKNFFFYPIAI